MKGSLLFWVFGLALGGLVTGCDDLGECDSARARELVITADGKVLYAGQAIMNASCANGQCHTSTATGKGRVGAPYGLDFDLPPAVSVAGASENTVTSGTLVLSASDVARLRRNQRKVFDERDEIWDQVKKGLMPPDGVGQSARDVSAGAVADTEKPCALKDALKSIGASESKQIFRNWLACGSPIVEASDPLISTTALKPVMADNGDAVRGLAGTVGQQMPACQGDCTKPLTFDDLYKSVFQASCVSCHQPGGQFGEFDLSTIDKAWAALQPNVGVAGADDCNDAAARAVVPGKPEDSYIITKMGGAGTNLSLCGATMPYLATPSQCSIDRVTAWIGAGAPGPGEPLP